MRLSEAIRSSRFPQFVAWLAARRNTPRAQGVAARTSDIRRQTRHACGVASEISAIVAEHGFALLEAPIIRVARPDAPVSAAPTHEAFVKPTPDKIVAAVRKVVG